MFKNRWDGSWLRICRALHGVVLDIELLAVLEVDIKT